MSGHTAPEAILNASTGVFEAGEQPWASLHPELLAVAKAIQSHTIQEMTNLSLAEATKPKEEPWSPKETLAKALRA